MLSIIILTKNEESVIADTLEGLKGFGSEIIVVDSDSDDRTAEIAAHMGAKVYKHALENFAAQRNYAMTRTKNDWVLYIDADEHVTRKFKEEVKNIIQSYQKQSEIGGYFIRRKTFYYGKDWGMTDRVQRLFYKQKFIEWYGAVHETPKIRGTFGTIQPPILHYTHRNLSQMVAKTNEWSEFEAEQRFRAHHPKMTTWRFLRVMITAFINSYIFNKGYKNGTEGVIEAVYQSFSMFVTYAKLWEKQR